MNSGIYYFLNDVDFDISNFNAAFSFDNQFTSNINNYIYPDAWASNSATGILTGNNSFFNFSGTGFFNGNTLIQLNKPLTFDISSTIFFSYSKQRAGDEILFSSIEGNSFDTYSGFCVGVNDANKLYFKYWNDVEGNFTFTYKNILSDKNLIMVQKNENILTLGRFNNNTFLFDTEDFIIKNNVFLESNTLYLGGSKTKPYWFNPNVKNFSGYIDNFYFIKDFFSFYNQLFVTGLLYEPKISNVFNYECFITGFLSGSGFSVTGVTGSKVELTTTINTGITGYISILTGNIYTGVTGYENILIGISVDNCGVTKDIYLQKELSGIINNQYTIDIPQTGLFVETGFLQIDFTGFITGIVNIFITGEKCYEIISGQKIDFTQKNLLKNYSYSEISLLKSFDSNKNDNIEIYFEPYEEKTLFYNKDYTYNSLLGSFYDIGNNDFQLSLFANGQLLSESGYDLLKSGYDEFIIPNLDYFITGAKVETNRYFGEEDFLFFDYFSGQTNIFYLSNYTSGTILPILGYESSLIFKNGQKLIPGLDYGTFTSNLLQTISGATGYADSFGAPFSINSDGAIIFVSAMAHRNSLNQSIGKLYIYKKNSLHYNLIQEISGNIVDGFFGNNLSTSSDGRILAISNRSENNGRVWVYQSSNLSNWSLHQTLSGNAGSLFFGEKLALSPDGTVLTVGSKLDGLNVETPKATGSMWIYTGGFNRTWTQTQKITGLMNSVGFADIGWPANQVINSGGNVLCIGFDSKKISTDSFAGVVSVYTGVNGVYNFSQELIGDPVGQSSGDLFGRSLAISNNGNILTVGSLHDQNFEQRTLNGAMFVFETGSDGKFNLQQKLLGDFDSRDRINDHFGYFSDMTDNGSIIITSSQHDSDDWKNPNTPGGEQNDGAVWLLGKDGNKWYLIKKLKSSLPNRYFGLSCRISRDGKILMTSRRQNANDGSGPSAIDLFEQVLGLNFNFNITSNPEFFVIKNNIPNFEITSNILEGSTKILNQFNNGCSQVYYNGIRQKINNNYIENSNFDMISGTFYEPDTNIIIYNNTNDFFV
jgi:hypothetical protein